MTDQKPETNAAANDAKARIDAENRRAFMKRFGKYALYTPPVMAALLYPGKAQAKQVSIGP